MIASTPPGRRCSGGAISHRAKYLYFYDAVGRLNSIRDDCMTQTVTSTPCAPNTNDGGDGDVWVAGEMTGVTM